MGNTAAELFERHGLTVFRYMRRMTGSIDSAQDLTQEVFLRVVRGLHTYRVHGREESWVLRIAHSVLFDHTCRSDGSSVKLVPLDEMPTEPQEGPSQLAALGFHEAVGLLPREDREAYLLRELGGLTYAELARVSETTEEAVRSRLYRARRQIKRVLSGRLVAGELKQREGE